MTLGTKLLLVLNLHRTWGRFHLRDVWRANMKPMNAALVSDERDCDQNEHHDENDALLIFRELENPEQALHFFA